jgi:NitT/TauT family transport system substrate-binding protein
VLEAGAEVRIIPADDYFQSMAQVVVASDKAIQEQPDQIRRLVRATIRGVEAVMADPAVAARDYVKAVPQHAGKEAAMQRVFEMYAKYVYRGQRPVGPMDVPRLTQLQDFYLKQGIIERATPVDQLYTDQFVR